MSTPYIDIGAILSSVVDAIVNALTAFVNVVAQYLPTIVQLALIGGIIGGVFYLVRRFGGTIAGWLRGLFRF